MWDKYSTNPIMRRRRTGFRNKAWTKSVQKVINEILAVRDQLEARLNRGEISNQDYIRLTDRMTTLLQKTEEWGAAIYEVSDD